jgi:hypothetical protein
MLHLPGSPNGEQMTLMLGPGRPKGLVRRVRATTRWNFHGTSEFVHRDPGSVDNAPTRTFVSAAVRTCPAFHPKWELNVQRSGALNLGADLNFAGGGRFRDPPCVALSSFRCGVRFAVAGHAHAGRSSVSYPTTSSMTTHKRPRSQVAGVCMTTPASGIGVTPAGGVTTAVGPGDHPGPH